MSKIMYYVYFTQDKRGLHIHKFKDLISARKSLRNYILNSNKQNLPSPFPIDGYTCDIFIDQESGCTFKKETNGNPSVRMVLGIHIGDMWYDGCVEYRSGKTKTTREVMADGTLGTTYYKCDL